MIAKREAFVRLASEPCPDPRLLSREATVGDSLGRKSQGNERESWSSREATVGGGGSAHLLKLCISTLAEGLQSP